MNTIGCILASKDVLNTPVLKSVRKSNKCDPIRITITVKYHNSVNSPIY